MLERRVLAHGMAALVSLRLESAGFLAAFSERDGGISEGPFQSLNLGLRSGDRVDAVSGNRRRLCEALGVPPFACGRQAHGSRLARVGRRSAGAGFDDPAFAFPRTDALTTAERGIPLAVLAADCVPVALADPVAGRVAVVHAGWRGIAGGVIASALRAFPEPRRVLAAIGPAIGPDHYEVGDDVARAVGASTPGGAVLSGRGTRRLLDLPATAARVLRGSGVRHVEACDACTACNPDRFYSYRRDGVTGRQGLVAMRL